MRSIFTQSKNQGNHHHLVRELDIGDAEYCAIGMTPNMLEETSSKSWALLQHQETHRLPYNCLATCRGQGQSPATSR